MEDNVPDGQVGSAYLLHVTSRSQRLGSALRGRVGRLDEGFPKQCTAGGDLSLILLLSMWEAPLDLHWSPSAMPLILAILAPALTCRVEMVGLVSACPSSL